MDVAQERRPSGPGFCVARDRPHCCCPPALGCSVHPDRPSQSLHACPSLPTTGLLGHAAGEQRYGELRAGEAPRTDVLGWLRAPREQRAQWHPELGPRLGGVSSESTRSPQGRTWSLLWCLPSRHSRRRRNRAGAPFKDNCQHVGDTGAIWLSHPRASGLQPAAGLILGRHPPSVEDVAVKGRVSLLAEWAVERSAGVAHARACLGGLSAAPGWRQRPARIMGRWTARVPEAAGSSVCRCGADPAPRGLRSGCST